MLKINKKVEYAIIGLIYMSEKKDGSLTTATELSEKFNIPQEIMRKILQNLARKNLIVSVQGVKGGYYLSEPLEKISLTRVVNAIEGPIQLVSCIEPEDLCGCEQLSFCNIRNPMNVLQQLIMQFFNTISLKDLKTHIPHVISNYPFLKAIIFFKEEMQGNTAPINNLLIGNK